MSKLEDAARALVKDYDATNQPDNIWTTLPVQWPYLEALRAALAEHEAAPPRELSEEEIVTLRDSLLPSQGERFDCIAFARAIERKVKGA